MSWRLLRATLLRFSNHCPLGRLFYYESETSSTPSTSTKNILASTRFDLCIDAIDVIHGNCVFRSLLHVSSFRTACCLWIDLDSDRSRIPFPLVPKVTLQHPTVINGTRLCFPWSASAPDINWQRPLALDLTRPVDLYAWVLAGCATCLPC
jgi:hypothetical protein